jgi:hypothetical protein
MRARNTLEQQRLQQERNSSTAAAATTEETLANMPALPSFADRSKRGRCYQDGNQNGYYAPATQRQHGPAVKQEVQEPDDLKAPTPTQKKNSKRKNPSRSPVANCRRLLTVAIAVAYQINQYQYSVSATTPLSNVVETTAEVCKDKITNSIEWERTGSAGGRQEDTDILDRAYSEWNAQGSK